VFSGGAIRFTDDLCFGFGDFFGEIGFGWMPLLTFDDKVDLSSWR